jgi:hypothetical protein
MQHWLMYWKSFKGLSERMTGVRTCHSKCLISETVKFTSMKFLSGSLDQILSAGFNSGLYRFSVTSPLLEDDTRMYIYICCHSTVDMHTVKCFSTDFAMWRLCLESNELLLVGRFDVRAKRFECFKKKICVWWGQIFGFISETTQEILTLLKPWVIICTVPPGLILKK